MGAEDGGFAARGERELMFRLAAIVDSSDDAIIGKTLDGTITSWNAGATAIYGYPPEEMIGRDIAALMPEDRVHELVPILSRLARGQRVSHFETKRVRKDGTVIDVSVSVSPVLDEHGTVLGAASVVRDVSARIRAEEDKRALHARLAQSERLETLGQLASGIAHDFNNLLGVIMSHASLLAEEADGQPEMLADIRPIELAAQRAARLTRQLLIFAKRDSAQPQDTDLDNVIGEMTELLAASVGGSIELRFDQAITPPVVKADRSHLEQVLLNLATNARDAMPQGGTLTIATGAAELDEAYCAARQHATPGHYVTLTVSDTGTGMSPEVAARIFEPFFTTKDAGRGTGLGLSTVYGIVTRCGGSISVQSERDAGTTFRVYLPAAARPTPATPAAPASADTAGGKRILVVDDEPTILSMVSRILAKDGYSVLEAHSGKEAMSMASSPDFAVDLLLTDSLLPHDAGFAERFAELKPGLRILRMTGDGTAQLTAEHSTEEVAIITKPFTSQALLEKVHAVLSSIRR
jgi:PAS domain S-box-containing protein